MSTERATIYTPMNGGVQTWDHFNTYVEMKTHTLEKQTAPYSYSYS